MNEQKNSKQRKKSTAILAIMIVALAIVTGAIFIWGIHTADEDAARSAEGAAAAGQKIVAASTQAEAFAAEALEESLEDMAAMLAAEHVYSHRGASLKEEEHTFAAYDQAIRDGSSFIEQDLVISKDGTLYVSHDQTATRMTGSGGTFSGMSDEEIDALRTPGGSEILRLSDVFDRYERTVHYVIELKSGDETTVRAFQELVENYGFQDQIIVQCFEPGPLQRLKESWPDTPMLYLMKAQQTFNEALDIDFVDILAVERSLMNQDNCDAAHEHGKQFNVWTLDSEQDIKTAIDLGVDTYFTNDTEQAISLEKEYRVPEILKTGTPSDGSGSEAASGDGKAALFFASDYQEEPEWPVPKNTLTALLETARGEGADPEALVICGDYTNEEGKYDYQLSPEDSIAEIRQIAGETFPELKEDHELFVQGNHDQLTESIADSGLHEFDDYLIYVLNTQNDYPWSQGKTSGAMKKVEASAAAMKDCFDELIQTKETRPVIIAGHVPLHFTARTSSLHSTGDNLYASLIFDVVNEAASSLDIIYLFGHNHSKGWDCYMGGSCVYKAAGETLLVPAFAKTDVTSDRYTEETLKFTYLNAGYLGYYVNCSMKEVLAGTAGDYSGADDTLTGTLCEIDGDTITLTRYDVHGMHPLGSEGTANPYVDDSKLIPAENYGRIVNSPQTIERKAN